MANRTGISWTDATWNPIVGCSIVSPGCTNCYAQPGGRAGNPHPMPRSLTHMRWLVNWWSEPGELIYDPYSGSGTTGVAAALEGRQFVGVDIDPQWEDVARRRIADALRQGDLLRGAHA